MENQNFGVENNPSPEILPEEMSDADNIRQTVPLASLIDERKKYQKQIEDEKSLRQKYENIIDYLGGNSSNADMNMAYDEILKNHGETAAKAWLDQQNKPQNLAVHSENQALLQDIQDKHREIYSVPEVKQAIDAYLKLDMDPNKSLTEQGFPEAVGYISSIYQSGYDAGLRLKAQNDAARARMNSSVNTAIPSGNHERAFTRAEISAMDCDTFAKHEKVIFDQMAKGLIK